MKKIKQILTTLVLVFGLLGCSSIDSGSSDSTPGVSTVSFNISPQKTTYSPGEEFKITASVDGDRVINGIPLHIGWNTVVRKGSIDSMGTKSDDTFTFKWNASSTSGGTLIVSASLPVFRSDGVDRVVTSGESSFTIVTQ
jgi:hypothetical protein